MRTLLLALLLTTAAPALAQAPAAVVVAEPDPARLAAANRLVDAVMPPALRDQMIEQTSGSMMANINQIVLTSPQLAPIFQKEPRARPIFERFLAQQSEASRTMLRESMPMMMTVMARSYARRLTVAQMDEARGFYATPAGQAFALAASSVMADPEFAAMMQQMMGKAMVRMPPQLKAMTDELRALGPLQSSPPTN